MISIKFALKDKSKVPIFAIVTVHRVLILGILSIIMTNTKLMSKDKSQIIIPLKQEKIITSFMQDVKAYPCSETQVEGVKPQTNQLNKTYSNQSNESSAFQILGSTLNNINNQTRESNYQTNQSTIHSVMDTRLEERMLVCPNCGGNGYRERKNDKGKYFFPSKDDTGHIMCGRCGYHWR